MRSRPDPARHRAARHGREALVRALLRAGAAADEAEPNYGLTPLHVAAQYGHAVSASMTRTIARHCEHTPVRRPTM